MKTSILAAALVPLMAACGSVDAAAPPEETFTLTAEWGSIASALTGRASRHIAHTCRFT